jgi:hypothetical protein
MRYLCYTYSMEQEPTRFQTLSVITDTEGANVKAIIHTLKRHTHYTIHIPRNRPTIDYRTGRLTP